MTVMRGGSIRRPSPTDSPKANSVVVRPFVKDEKSFSLLVNLANAIREAWPKKPEKFGAHFTGKTERAVQFWLSASTKMSVNDASALLRTDEGYLILEAIMGDCKAEWWITTKNAQALRITRRQIAQAQKRLDAIKAGQAQLDIFQQ